MKQKKKKGKKQRATADFSLIVCSPFACRNNGGYVREENKGKRRKKNKTFYIK